MDLVTRGRLSVQRVDEKAWDVIVQLAEKGGWEGLDLKPKKGSSTVARSKKVPKEKAKPIPRPRGTRKAKEDDDDDGNDEDAASEDDTGNGRVAKETGKKRKMVDEPEEDLVPRRRSTRTK
jgi:hypothetical protein